MAPRQPRHSSPQQFSPTHPRGSQGHPGPDLCPRASCLVDVPGTPPKAGYDRFAVAAPSWRLSSAIPYSLSLVNEPMECRQDMYRLDFFWTGSYTGHSQSQFRCLNERGRGPLLLHWPGPNPEPCGWWPHMGICHGLFELSMAKVRGLPSHQVLANRHHPQAWLQGWTLVPCSG